MEHLTWDHVLWEIIFSTIYDVIIIGLLLPLIIKIVKYKVNRERDLAHGHTNETPEVEQTKDYSREFKEHGGYGY